MAAVDAVAPDLGATQACQALGISRATLYRRRRPPAPPASSSPRPRPPRALSDAERQAVRAVLHAPRFVDVAPAEVVATLLDEGTYLASERTMYRILAEAGQTGERRNQLTHPRHARPELLATRPNELWSWDITKLLGPATWTYYYLYVILDVFSRYVVGWMVAHAEQAALAERLLAETTAKQQILPGTLTVHADRGSLDDLQAGRVPAGRPGGHQDPLPPARLQRQPVLREPVQDLEVSAGLSRPVRLHPGRPGVLPAVLRLVQREHRHSGIAMMTPEAVHYGHAAQLHQARARVLAAAYAAHPERFVRRPPAPKPLPTAVWINPPESTQEATQ